MYIWGDALNAPIANARTTRETEWLLQESGTCESDDVGHIYSA